MVESLRIRNNSTVKALKHKLGVDLFEEFKSLSRSFQHGKLTVHDYYHKALCTLQDDTALLLEVLALLPLRTLRDDVEEFHLKYDKGTTPPPPPSCQTSQHSGGLSQRPLTGRQQRRQQRQTAAVTVPGGDGVDGTSLSSSLTSPSPSAPQPAATTAAPFKLAGGGAERGKREKPAEISVLQPGLVLIRRCLSAAQQQWLVDETFRLGDGEDGVGGGFYKADGNLMRLNRGNKGRVIAPMDDFPLDYKQICENAVAQAMSADPDMPRMTPDVVLINFYSDASSLPWHRDNDAGKATECNLGKPVVSFSLGDAGDFGYKWRHEDQEQVLRLESGDCLLFGGPSRMILHSVMQIHPNTKQRSLKMKKGRLNITFRDHSELEEHEINLGYDGDNRLKAKNAS